MKKIELNADLGEGGAGDAQILPFIDAANIACGGHSGDQRTMLKTLLLSQQQGVVAGAHPSYPDKQHFGRRELKIEVSELQRSLRKQLQSLSEIASAIGYPLRHIKPHGALYNRCTSDSALASHVIECFARFNDSLIVVGLAGGELTHIANERGLNVQQEGFVDRRYNDDGRLLPRGSANAVIDDITTACNQARQIAKEGNITSINNHTLTIEIDTLCLHGDGENAIAIAQHVSQIVRPKKKTP